MRITLRQTAEGWSWKARFENPGKTIGILYSLPTAKEALESALEVIAKVEKDIHK